MTSLELGCVDQIERFDQPHRHGPRCAASRPGTDSRQPAAHHREEHPMNNLDQQTALARHLNAIDGWITAGYFNSADPDEIAARDAMLADGRLNARTWDGIAIIELTPAGAAWLLAEEGR